MSPADRKRQSKVYELLSKKAPRRGVGGLSAAYWRGFDCRTRAPLRTSLAYAAWRAGRDARLQS